MRPLPGLLLLLLIASAVTADAARPRPAGPPLAERMVVAVLAGDKVAPATASAATGRATFLVSADGREVRYRVTVSRLAEVTLVAPRLGAGQVNGEPVALLLGPRRVRGATTGLLVEGVLTPGDTRGRFAGAPTVLGLAEAMRAQRVYVEIDTAAFPTGEIRGQVHGDRRRAEAL